MLRSASHALEGFIVHLLALLSPPVSVLKGMRHMRLYAFCYSNIIPRITCILLYHNFPKGFIVLRKQRHPLLRTGSQAMSAPRVIIVLLESLALCHVIQGLLLQSLRALNAGPALLAGTAWMGHCSCAQLVGSLVSHWLCSE